MARVGQSHLESKQQKRIKKASFDIVFDFAILQSYVFMRRRNVSWVLHPTTTSGQTMIDNDKHLAQPLHIPLVVPPANHFNSNFERLSEARNRRQTTEDSKVYSKCCPRIIEYRLEEKHGRRRKSSWHACANLSMAPDS